MENIMHVENTNVMTTSEKRLLKIKQLKARLQKETARLSQQERKLRNGQLIALGILGEQLYKAASREERLMMATQAGQLLSGRNLERVLGAFKRLEGEEN